MVHSRGRWYCWLSKLTGQPLRQAKESSLPIVQVPAHLTIFLIWQLLCFKWFVQMVIIFKIFFFSCCCSNDSSVFVSFIYIGHHPRQIYRLGRGGFVNSIWWVINFYHFVFHHIFVSNFGIVFTLLLLTPNKSSNCFKTKIMIKSDAIFGVPSVDYQAVWDTQVPTTLHFHQPKCMWWLYSPPSFNKSAIWCNRMAKVLFFFWMLLFVFPAMWRLSEVKKSNVLFSWPLRSVQAIYSPFDLHLLDLLKNGWFW